MGSIEFICSCGKTNFLNSIDNRSYVAHFIPDQHWDQFWNAVDSAVERSGPTPNDKDAACMSLRKADPHRHIWQCPQCGSLYVEDANRIRHRFVPDSPAVPKTLLRVRTE